VLKQTILVKNKWLKIILNRNMFVSLILLVNWMLYNGYYSIYITGVRAFIIICINNLLICVSFSRGTNPLQFLRKNGMLLFLVILFSVFPCYVYFFFKVSQNSQISRLINCGQWALKKLYYPPPPPFLRELSIPYGIFL
jgi:hypothetical protein